MTKHTYDTTKLTDDTNPFKAAEMKAEGEDLLKDFIVLRAWRLSMVSCSLWRAAESAG